MILLRSFNHANLFSLLNNYNLTIRYAVLLFCGSLILIHNLILTIKVKKEILQLSDLSQSFLK